MTTERKLSDDKLEWWRTFLARMASMMGTEGVEYTLRGAVEAGELEEEDAADLYDEFYLHAIGISQEVQYYLSQYTSKDDLADRMLRMGIAPELQSSIYTNFISQATSSELAIRKARGRVLTEQKELAEEEVGVQTEIQAGREERAGYLSEALSSIYNDPLITQEDLAGIRESLAGGTEAFLTGQSDDIMVRLGELKQQAAQRSMGEGQRAEALLAGIKQPKTVAKEEELPPMPKAKPLAESFLEETKLGKGTKLRGFIEREIPSIWEETRAAREKWWKGAHPQEVELPTFEGAKERTTAEMEKWGRIAKHAPTSEYAGEMYYGPGGLRAIAEEAFQSAHQRLAGLRPEDFEERTRPSLVSKEEDPFRKALRRKNFMAGFYRQPRVMAEATRRLRPAVRW